MLAPDDCAIVVCSVMGYVFVRAGEVMAQDAMDCAIAMACRVRSEKGFSVRYLDAVRKWFGQNINLWSNVVVFFAQLHHVAGQIWCSV